MTTHIRRSDEWRSWPASTYKDCRPKRWLPYPQARAYYWNALLPLLIGWSEERAEIALALPEQPTNVRLVDRTASALRQLGIGVYFVDGEGRAGTPSIDHGSEDRGVPGHLARHPCRRWSVRR